MGNGLANCLATGNGTVTTTILQGTHRQGQCVNMCEFGRSLRCKVTQITEQKNYIVKKKKNKKNKK